MIKDRAFGRQDSTAAAREANKMFRKVETTPSDHAKADKAFQANRERLKAERLAPESKHPANKAR
ncbi:hypothetical protein [Bradyrhizobium elkanii]|uniref:hypothetical protein n=1 Tax=Bradyrhizobium elkanii TaxID=29448 RepID=UPI000841B913|nr:hypothetical protein [Bradyrhizobium elkanii]ODM71888.1 hypothetical protein A6452_06565 [Bradyrhizobium elkanii]ODM84782.1 hypothetical protein A6X20_12650 [Bradyrhizobium elkanii]